VRIQRLAPPSGDVTELILDANEKQLVVGDDAGVISLWDLSEPEGPVRLVEPVFTNVDALAWLPARDGFIAAGRDGIGAWRLRDGAELGRWPKLSSSPQSVAVVDHRLALVACEAAVRLVDFEAGAVVAEAPLGERNTGIAYDGSKGRYAICSCDQGGSQIVWVEVVRDGLNVTERPLLERDVDHLSAPAISAAGQLIMVADHRLGIFEIPTGHRIAGFDTDGSAGRRLGDGLLVERFWTQCVSLGAEALACASPDGLLLVFDVHSRTISQRDGLVSPAVALGSDRDVLVAASLDWSISIWWP
jgi:hypothetical protein